MRFGGGFGPTWRQLFQYSNGDTVGAAELAPMVGDSPWVGSTNNRTTPFPRHTVLSHMITTLSTNSNTADGALIRLVVTPFVNPFVFTNGNINVVVDQATGLFEDITNEDVLSETVLQGARWGYFFVDGTIVVRSIAVEGRG